MPRCAFVTLGCKVNQYDTQALREALARLGCQEAAPGAEADLYLVNTCCVTRESHAKGLQAVRRIAREHPNAPIVVTGCSADADPDAFRSLPSVHWVAGNAAKPLLPELLADALRAGHRPDGPPISNQKSEIRNPPWPPISSFAGHTRAFVKIEDGCNDFCAYCVVPLVRGRVRSRPPDEVVAEVERLAGNGYLEVVLTGIHLGAYGSDAASSSSSSLVPRPRSSPPIAGRAEDEDEGRGRGRDKPAGGLVPLIERLLATPGLRRLRLSSLELREVSDDLIRLAAASHVLCPHFHIPLQSGDDAVLRAMNRRYTAADFLRRLDLIRSLIEEPAITTDVLVGFPGESDEAFRRTLAVARQAGFSRVHIFPYSERPGTAAAAMPGKLPWPTIRARRNEARSLASDLMAAYHTRFVGRTVAPLVESQRDPRTGLLCGYTERYVRTLFDGPDQLKGTIPPVRVAALTPGGVRGELLGA